MKNIEIESGNIKSLFYEEKDENLIVFFQSGSYYIYYKVSQEIVNKMLTKKKNKRGKFFQENIKNNYEFKKVY